jgi:hypothetical protein
MAIAAGKLVEVETILPTWKRAMREIRQTLLAVPGRCRARAPHWSNFDQTIVDDELRGVKRQPLAAPRKTLWIGQWLAFALLR